MENWHKTKIALGHLVPRIAPTIAGLKLIKPDLQYG
jgi:hypothetical protein